MNLKRAIGISVALNLFFVPLGSVYLAQRIRAVIPKVQEQKHPPAPAASLLSNPDYQWRSQLFSAEPTRLDATIFLGDSITEAGFWQAVWQVEMPTPVLNRGLAGDTIDGVIGRLDEVLRHRPRQVFIVIGVNDLLLYGRSVNELSAAMRDSSTGFERMRRSPGYSSRAFFLSAARGMTPSMP